MSTGPGLSNTSYAPVNGTPIDELVDHLGQPIAVRRHVDDAGVEVTTLWLHGNVGCETALDEVATLDPSQMGTAPDASATP